MTSIFDYNSFPSYSIRTPTNAGAIGSGTTFSLILSDGTTQQVWDVLSTGLKLMDYMNSKSMYYLAANDYITIINCGAKLLVLENTLLNQKLMNSFEFTTDRDADANPPDHLISIYLNYPNGGDVMTIWDTKWSVYSS